MDAWLLLILGLLPKPSSLRVRTWRRLRAMGAVALKRSVYLLPATPEHYERFQWLAQEVQRDGGEATLVRAERIENLSSVEVIRLFQDARNRDYQQLATRCRKVLAGAEHLAGRPNPRFIGELARVEREFDRIHEIDFFDAPARPEVERLREALTRHVRPPEDTRDGRTVPVELGQLQGRRWVTRPRPHVDRIGSAWLIKRFIDPEATFLFAEPGEFPPDAVAFDAPGAALSHEGPDCTFETLLKRTGLRDARLHRLAEIVHEADLRDGQFPRDEARGVDLALRGLLAALKDDQDVLAYGLTLFDGLYASLGES